MSLRIAFRLLRWDSPIPPKAPIYTYVNPNANNDLCSVCLDDMRPREPSIVEMTKCRHTFHQDCIDRWLTIHSTCPICRHVAK